MRLVVKYKECSVLKADLWLYEILVVFREVNGRAA
jgi:hypothetical protein